MMKRLLPSVMLLLAFACEKFDAYDSFPTPDTRAEAYAVEGPTVVDGDLVVGDTLAHPFTVEEMWYTVQSMKPRDFGPHVGRITESMVPELGAIQSNKKPSHYHVKILPKNLEELRLLDADTTLFLYPYPLDHAISGEGELSYTEAYFDFEFGNVTLNDEIGPLYASIPAYKTLPEGIAYTVLEELFLPDQIDQRMAEELNMYSAISAETAAVVIDQAMWRANLETEALIARQNAHPWYPSGKITVYDTETGRYVGVPHAKVVVRSGLFRSECAYTDENGEFALTTAYTRPVSYRVVWKNETWDIRRNDFEIAAYDGPQQRTPWNLEIGTSHPAFGYATATRALYTHFYGANPYDNIRDYSDKRISVAYLNKYNSGTSARFYHWYEAGTIPTITVYGLQADNRPMTSPQILNTVFHQLGNCAMFHRCEAQNKTYADFSESIRESWGEFIGWALVNKVYKTLGHDLTVYVRGQVDGSMLWLNFDKPDSYNLQGLTSTDYSRIDYWQKHTPLFIDLADDSDQRDYFRFIELSDSYALYPEDRLCVNSLKRLNDLLYDSPTLSALKINLGANGATLGLTQTDIDLYFDFYGL